MPASMSSASSSPDALASSLVSRTEARLRIFAIASASASCALAALKKACPQASLNEKGYLGTIGSIVDAVASA